MLCEIRFLILETFYARFIKKYRCQCPNLWDYYSFGGMGDWWRVGKYVEKIWFNDIGLELISSSNDEIVYEVPTTSNQIKLDAISLVASVIDMLKKDIKEKALNMVKELLTTEQVQYLLKKYELDDIDKIIDVLIESSISEVRKEEKIN